MKSDAISTHERALIIRHLAEHGKWQATRLDAEVCIARIRTLKPKRWSIHYYVLSDGVKATGVRRTVAEAIETINQAVRPKPRKFEPLSTCAHLRPGWMENYRLPYADADLQEAEA